MPDAPLVLAGDVPAATHEQWVEAAEAALRGRPLASLTRTTLDGIEIAPLYTREDRDGTEAPALTRRAAGTWGIRQLHRHPDPATANLQVLEDLERSVTEVLLRLDRTTRAGLDPDAEDAAFGVGDDGVAISTLAGLARVLDEVLLDLAPIALDAGAAFLPAGAALLALLEDAGAPGAAGALRADPIGHLAATGELPQGLDAAWDQLAGLAAHAAARFPNVTSVAVDTSPYVSAGASDGSELAAALSAGVTYLRVMTDRGLDLASALSQIEFTLSATADQFATIAKLRAFRRLWARVAEACGADEADRAARLHAIAAERMLTVRDPWVNLLRGTVAGFAAAVGGADSVTILPFDAAIGLSDDLARRVARNTQLILAEESHVGRVADPGRGSWHLEQLTDDLAAAAWTQFQTLEAGGGIVAGLLDGSVHAQLEQTWAKRVADTATRREPITGVTEFPDLHESPVERDAPDHSDILAGAIARSTATRPADLGDLTDAAAVIAAVRAGASFGQIVAAMSGEVPAEIEPLPYHRLAEDVELLRDLSDAHLGTTGARPTVFLANLGPIATHTARASFATNLLAAGGIAVVTNDGFEDEDALAAAFADSDATIACICSSDDVYTDRAAAAAQALKAAGATRVLLAGRPPDDPYPHVDSYVHVRTDIVAVLTEVLQTLEVMPS